MLIFISVVRDLDLYKRFFQENKFTNSHKLVYFDNNLENLGISQRYNQFLDSYDYSCEHWLVFCHEDFLLNEDILPKLKPISQNHIYGPIGTTVSKNILKINFDNESYELVERNIHGQIIQTNKTGIDKHIFGNRLEKSVEVDTVDCCCLIVHSSLIKKYNLRFDENLTFDLYSEAFSIEAKEKHQIPTQVIQIDCEHWSEGNITQRYYNGLMYLNQKYPTALYSGTCSFIGGKSFILGTTLINNFIRYIRISERLGLGLIIKFALFAFKKLSSLKRLYMNNN
jgi:hypothetical protein